jgi:NAD(P) transhydrogenase
VRDVDLLVIGSGPAGQRAAIQAAKCGASVTVIERRDVVGGVCTHAGTIPSKTLREAILYLTGFRYRNVYGRGHGPKRRLTFDDLLYRVSHVVKHETGVVRDKLNRNGVEVVTGVAAFDGPHEISVATDAEERRFRAEKIIIAVGSKPYRADRVPFNDTNIIDSDSLWRPGFRIEGMPRSMLFIGAGVIGTEYACMFSALGVDVALLDRRTELFRFIDQEINDALIFHMRNEKVTLYLGKDFANVRLDENGKVITTLEHGREIKTDMLMFCSGRAGATDGLNLEAAGVEAGNRGLLKVNDNLQTNVPHIYACGDVIGFPALASTSMEQGRHAACHAFGVPFKSQTELMPYGIYTIPEISIVGKTEQELSEQGVPYEIGIARYREIVKGQIMGDEIGMLKLVFHQKSGRLLGVHIIGDGASELIHIGQAVLAYGGSISYFVDTVFNYPTLAEAYKVAALNGLKRVGVAAMSTEEFARPIVELNTGVP